MHHGLHDHPDAPRLSPAGQDVEQDITEGYHSSSAMHGSLWDLSKSIHQAQVRDALRARGRRLVQHQRVVLRRRRGRWLDAY